MKPLGPRLVPGVAVVAGQLLLSLAAFNPAPHSGGDNATYVSLAHGLLERGAYTEVFDPAQRPHTKYPPVFPALLSLWILLGARTWTALKTTAVLFSALSVLLAYLWASERRGPVFGAFVAALYALSVAAVDASHWILSEPPFMAATLLALWAFDRSRRPERDTGTAAAGGEGGALVLLGGVGAVLAYFTRSAGLPLVVAAAGWLAWRRRWRALALFAAGAGAPALIWWLRVRRFADVSYADEFWMVDPYDPSLGRIGLAGLAGRFLRNALGYVSRHVPEGIVGAQGGWPTLIGVGLVALAAVGWLRSVRAGPGVAELFVPLYAGLIFLWPEAWSGYRFALPLYPLLFLYAGDALLARAGRAGRRIIPVVALAAFLAVGIPAAVAWSRSVSVARLCTAAVRVSGPFGCYGPPVEEFVLIALWSRSALPEGAAVLSRKPSIFYVMSGLPSRTFPFSPDPDVLIAEAEEAGARYVVVDHWDPQALRYVVEAVTRRPAAFCVVGGFDPRGGAAGTLLLGIVPGAAAVPEEPAGPALTLERCPEAMLADVSAPVPDYAPASVPVLVRDAPRR